MNESNEPDEANARDPLGSLVGAARFAAAGFVVVVGTVVVLATGWAPLRVRGARLAGWVVTGMARTATTLFGVRIVCDQPERLRLHRGFVFPNHVSFVDILVLLHLFPLRFLSNHVVERTLFVGWVAKAIGTVFVDRRDSEARAEARRELADALAEQDHPPLVLFPEGRIGEGEVLHPLRRGAFEVAAEGAIPYLLCAIRYSDLDAVHWRRREPFFAALWRLARHRGPLTARLVFLGSVHPTPADDPDALVRHAESLLGAAISTPRGDATAGAAGP
ncbi:MAG: lysophospholipid acyltransferase family protein [Rhodothermales bacterium]